MLHILEIQQNPLAVNMQTGFIFFQLLGSPLFIRVIGPQFKLLFGKLI